MIKKLTTKFEFQKEDRIQLERNEQMELPHQPSNKAGKIFLYINQYVTWIDKKKRNLLFMSTSAFLQTMLAKRRPIPLIEVRANMIFCFPSTFVFRTRRMCWKSSFATSDCRSKSPPETKDLINHLRNSQEVENRQGSEKHSTYHGGG